MDDTLQHIPDLGTNDGYFNFELIDIAARLTNASMFVIDYTRNKMAYRTKSLLFIDEVRENNTLRKDPNPYWSLVTKSDFDAIYEGRKAYLNLMEGFNLQQRLQNTCVIDCHINLRNRPHMVTLKFTPLRLRDEGRRLWLGLFCISTSSYKSDKRLTVLGSEFCYKYDFEKKSFFPAKRIELSTLEKDILVRASEGMASEQIADDLCRSVNTIKTHKSRLYEKLHVNSMSEALAITKNYNLL